MAVSQTSVIELAITLSSSFFSPRLSERLCTPTVEINGKKESRAWGLHRLELPPGTYDVSVSYPSLIVSECQKNTVRVELEPGQTRKITYRAGYLRFQPGEITVV
jgi:hypothetical protein